MKTTTKKVTPARRTQKRVPVSRPDPTKVCVRFGKRLRDLRYAENRMTQEVMASRFGIGRSFISNLEKGKQSPSLDMLAVLAVGFRVSLSELLRDV